MVTLYGGLHTEFDEHTVRCAVPVRSSGSMTLTCCNPGTPGASPEYTDGRLRVPIFTTAPAIGGKPVRKICRVLPLRAALPVAFTELSSLRMPFGKIAGAASTRLTLTGEPLRPSTDTSICAELLPAREAGTSRFICDVPL